MFESESFNKPLRDNEYPDPTDEDFEDGFNEEIDCPHCGAAVYEDALRCPLCGEYISDTHPVWAGRSLMWIVLGLAGIAAVIASLSGLI